MVSTYPLICESSNLFTNPMGIVPSEPATVGITVTSCSIVSSALKQGSDIIPPFLKFYYMVCWGSRVHYSAGSLFFFCWLSLCMVAWPILIDPFVSQNPRELCASHSPRLILRYAYTNCLYGRISIYCTIASGSLSPPNCWLVGLVLWHINLCWLFKAKSIFIRIISSISNNSVLHEYSV